MWGVVEAWLGRSVAVAVAVSVAAWLSVLGNGRVYLRGGTERFKYRVARIVQGSTVYRIRVALVIHRV